VADHQRAHALSPVGPDIEEPRTLRRADPLVAVPRVVCGAERPEVERHHAGGVGAVDQRVDTLRRELADEGLDRQDEPCRARHMVDERQPRPRSHPGEHRLQRLLRRRHGERQRRHDDTDPRARRDGVDGVPAGVVGVVRGEDLVPRREVNGPEHGVHARGRIRDEGEAVRIGPDEGAQRPARFVQQPLQFPGQEPRRLGFQPVPEARLGVQHRAGAGAERSVIEEGDTSVEGPEAPPPVGRTSRRGHDSPSSATRPRVVNGPPRGPGRHPAPAPRRGLSPWAPLGFPGIAAPAQLDGAPSPRLARKGSVTVE
jgi:hypothetical protein